VKLGHKGLRESRARQDLRVKLGHRGHRESRAR